jgi:phosphatidylserine/phosphatidylglycerophosphate/cardiolipin synthase-like enzyme
MNSLSTHSYKPVSDEFLFRSLRFDLLGASRLLGAIAQSPSPHLSADMIADMARDEGVSTERTRRLIDSFVDLRILERSSGPLTRVLSQSDARKGSIFLRGAANAAFEFRDSNSVEIVLSPPLHPSRLMEVLPKQKFGWARLHNTRDALIALATTAQRRLVILSPFLDDVGMDWVEELFAAPPSEVERVLVVRGTHPFLCDKLESRRSEHSRQGIKVYRYAIEHDPGTRDAKIETFHAKIVLCDKDAAYIGSSNMNRASRELSLECGVHIAGPCVRPVATLVDSILSIAEKY